MLIKMISVMASIALVFLIIIFIVRIRRYVRASSVLQVSLADVEVACQPNSRIMILDVRTRAEYDEGHLPGAISLSLYELAEKINQVPRDRPVYVICKSGKRSLQAVKFLMSQGYRQVFHVSQGMEHWQGAIVKGTG